MGGTLSVLAQVGSAWSEWQAARSRVVLTAFLGVLWFGCALEGASGEMKCDRVTDLVNECVNFLGINVNK